jgi:peptidoglycan/LPS O-acetylase OafA/YrhL
MTSGFFFYLKWEGLTTYRANVRKRISTLLVPYVLASGLILIAYIPAHILFTDEGYNLTVFNVLRDWLLHPVMTQFWFLRDLLLIVLISPLLYIPRKRYSLILGGVLFVLWLFQIQVFPIVFGWYLISIEMLLFFWFGGFMTFHVDLLEKLVETKSRWVWLLAAVWLALALTRLFVDPTLDLWYARNFTLTSLLIYKLTILAELPLLFIVASRLINRVTLYLARYTFFVFLFHTFPLSAVVTLVTENLVGMEYSFYPNVIIATAASYLAAIFCATYLTPFYNVVTGDRTVSIAQQQAALAQPVGGLKPVPEG